MNKVKLYIKVLFIFLLISTNIYAGEYEDYLKEYNQSYNKYKNDINKEFEAYKNAYDKAFDEYKDDISKRWPTNEISTKHKWVEYTSNYNNKKIVNYEKEVISFEVIAKNEKEAQIKILEMFDKLNKYDVKKAYKNDILEKKIAKKLDKIREVPKSNKKLIADIINKNQRKSMRNTISEQKFKRVKHKGKFIYKANVKFPPNSMIKKAKTYKNDVKKQANKTDMPEELIYAIMHSESSFNPMARSHIPAFGLMQIVSRSAGVDTYKYLTGKKKLLSAQYLYNSKNNIVIGSTYLKILYTRYLKRITNPQSRMYCTIAAYNTGAGNVSKAFNGTTNIAKASKKINSMSSDQVYKRLMKKLPYNETKKYLYKVNNRMGMYHNLIKNNSI